MGRSLENTITGILKTSEVRTIGELFDKIRIESKTKLSDKKLNVKINDILNKLPIAFVDENDQIIYRKELFQVCNFKISLTPEEYSESELIIGHRFIPFLNPEIKPGDIVLIDEYFNHIPKQQDKQHIPDVRIYFSFFNIYEIAGKFEIEKDYINYSYFNLTNWIKENNFLPEDQIWVSALDYDKGLFQIKKYSKREANLDTFTNKIRVEQLENAIAEIFNKEKSFITVDLQLFKAFAKLEKGAILNPGDPLGKIVSNSEKITLSSLGEVSMLVVKGEDIMKRFFEEWLSEKKPEMGKSKSIEGIFDELGISFSEKFIIGMLILQLKKEKQINLDKILNIIFSRDYFPFFNEKQENNFFTAFNKLIDKNIQVWERQPLSNQKLDLLSEAIGLKIKITGLLREIDENVEDPKSIDLTPLITLNPIDEFVDTIISSIVGQDSTLDEEITEIIDKIKELKNILKTIQKMLLNQSPE